MRRGVAPCLGAVDRCKRIHDSLCKAWLPLATLPCGWLLLNINMHERLMRSFHVLHLMFGLFGSCSVRVRSSRCSVFCSVRPLYKRGVRTNIIPNLNGRQSSDLRLLGRDPWT